MTHYPQINVNQIENKMEFVSLSYISPNNILSNLNSYRVKNPPFYLHSSPNILKYLSFLKNQISSSCFQIPKWSHKHNN